MRSLLRRQSEYIGSHARERRAPDDATCVACSGTDGLVHCSVCNNWRCVDHFTMHEAPTGWDDPKPSWLRRALRSVRRG